MSLPPQPVAPVPAQTVRVALAAFPKGPPSLTLRAQRGTLLQDEDCATLCPARGSPGLPPWRLARITLMPCRDNLADRQAAEAVRARIAWQERLGLELTDPGFDFSVRSALRDRLLAGQAEALLLAKLLERCRTLGLVQARGQQRTDSPHVLAAIRGLNRLDGVAETLRAALQALATVAPDWLPGLGPLAWDERYGQRSEETRLPPGQAKRDAYAQLGGEDGCWLLDTLEAPETPEGLREFPRSAPLRQAWQRPADRSTGEGARPGAPAVSQGRLKRNRA